VTALNFAKDALAVYRLTKLVIDDKITEDLREAVYAKYPPETTKIGYLFTCPWCVSMWVGFGVVAARKIAPDAWDAAATALAASSVSGLLEERR
jgi:hypothetical protein